VQRRQITVLSAGTWGITLAKLLFDKGYGVRVWEYSPQVVETLMNTRSHPKLPRFELPPGLEVTGSIEEALRDTPAGGPENGGAIICVVPAAHLRDTARMVVQAGYTGRLFVICSKGIENGSLKLMTDVAAEELGPESRGQLAVLSGPSHAEEVSLNMPTAITAASDDPRTAQVVQEMFMTPFFRVYSNTDIIGVELGGALKNVIAIACGISDGLGHGDNAKAALITRGLTEIIRLGTVMGAKAETFNGLTGMGDLVVTCMSQHSRNWRFGSLVGQGLSPQQALEKVGMVVEGQYTVQAAVALSRREQVELPISEAVFAVLFKGMSPRDAVASLMRREAKQEISD